LFLSNLVVCWRNLLLFLTPPAGPNGTSCLGSGLLLLSVQPASPSWTQPAPSVTGSGLWSVCDAGKGSSTGPDEYAVVQVAGINRTSTIEVVSLNITPLRLANSTAACGGSIAEPQPPPNSRPKKPRFLVFSLILILVKGAALSGLSLVGSVMRGRGVAAAAGALV
jgi:hypothetical protein